MKIKQLATPRKIIKMLVPYGLVRLYQKISERRRVAEARLCELCASVDVFEVPSKRSKLKLAWTGAASLVESLPFSSRVYRSRAALRTMKALAASKTPEAKATLDRMLRARLTSEDVIVRATAAELLGETKPADAASVLASAWQASRNDADIDARVAILEALVAVKADTATALLTEALDDRDWAVRAAAKECLESMGPDIWPVLVKLLDDHDRFVRNGAAEVFQNLGLLDSFIVMEAATDSPAQGKIDLLRRIVAAGELRLTDSLFERIGPALGPRVRRLLMDVGLEHVGAA